MKKLGAKIDMNSPKSFLTRGSYSQLTKQNESEKNIFGNLQTKQQQKMLQSGKENEPQEQQKQISKSKMIYNSPRCRNQTPDKSLQNRNLRKSSQQDRITSKIKIVTRNITLKESNKLDNQNFFRYTDTNESYSSKLHDKNAFVSNESQSKSTRYSEKENIKQKSSYNYVPKEVNLYEDINKSRSISKQKVQENVRNSTDGRLKKDNTQEKFISQLKLHQNFFKTTVDSTQSSSNELMQSSEPGSRSKNNLKDLLFDKNKKRDNSQKQKFRDYKKLQDKLSSLENKIQNIKSTTPQPCQAEISLSSILTQQKQPTRNQSSHVQTVQAAQNVQKPQNVQKTQNVQNTNLKNSNENTKDMLIETINVIPRSYLNKATAKSPSENYQTEKKQIDKLYYIGQLYKNFYQNFENEREKEWQVIVQDHLYQTMQAICFSRMVQPSTLKQLEEHMVDLGPKKHLNRKTIVFDLDETLIHCNESVDIPSDIILPITFPSGEIIDVIKSLVNISQAGIMIRPYTHFLLQEISKHFEIVVFTASHSCYANVVLDYLDPEQKYISHRLFRENCVQNDGIYIKDLRVLKGRNMNEILLVDNAAYSFCFQIENGIPILPFYNDKNDQELLTLIGYLKNFINCNNMRDFNKNFMRLMQWEEYQGGQEIIQGVYKDFINQ